MKLPSINSTAISGERTVLHIALPTNCEAFDGHFPGTPILPGVVQVDWAIRLAHQYLQIPQIVAKDFRIKFNRIISPDMPLELHLELVHGKLDFSYQVNGDLMSSGQIKL